MSLPGFVYTDHMLSAVRARLASRLNDPDNCFWSSTELDWYLQEALDCWGLYARYFSVRGTLTVTAGEFEADLSAVSTTAFDGVTAESALSFSVSGQKILKACLLHLLETRSTDLTTYTATGHISTDLLNHYIPLAVNQFLQESFSYVTKREYPLTSAVLSSNSGRFTLDEKINNLVRVEHISLESNVRNLRRVSLNDAKNLRSNVWNSQSRPEFYTIETTPMLQMYLLPWPNDLATLRLYSVEHTKLASNLYATDQSFSFPYEFWWAVKFLTLYKVYSTDGPTQYPQMAEYCLKRYKECLTVARDYSSLNFAWVEERPMHLSPMTEFDNMYAGWRNRSAIDLDAGGRLNKELGIMSPNKIFLRSKYSRDISLSFDLVRNAPTLTSTDEFPVGEDYLPYILDYAEHLACIKMGGKEFSDSYPLYESFLAGAMRLNDRLKASIASLNPPSKVAYRQSQSSQESDKREAKVGVGGQG